MLQPHCLSLLLRLGSPCLDRAHSPRAKESAGSILTHLASGNKTMKMPHPFKVTALYILFLKATIVTSECSYDSSYSCTNKGFSSTFTVDFINTGSSEYEASTRFVWDLDDETIIDTYSSGQYEQVSHTFTHGIAGTFIVGFSLVFGDGSCEKRFDEVYELTYDVETKSCNFFLYDGATHEPGPPESATPEPATPEPATPEPTAPEPITPAPIFPVVVDVSCCFRLVVCLILMRYSIQNNSSFFLSGYTKIPTSPPPTKRPTMSPSKATPSPTQVPTPLPVIDIMEPTDGEGPTLPPFNDVVLPFCGDDVCEPTTEDNATCPDDCPAPSTPDSTPAPSPSSATPAPTYDETKDSSAEKTMSPTNVNDRPAELPSISPTELIPPGCCDCGCDCDCDEPDFDAATSEESGNGGESPNNLPFIIGGVAGGACGIVVTLAFGLYFVRRGKRKDATQFSGEKSEPDRTGLEIETKTTKSITRSETVNQQGGSHVSIQQGESYFGTIQQTDVDDISTLGDPYMGEAVKAVLDADVTVGEER